MPMYAGVCYLYPKLVRRFVVKRKREKECTFVKERGREDGKKYWAKIVTG